MVQFYTTVTIYADTGIRLKEFLDTHKEYTSITKFIDAAVNEKLDREAVVKEQQQLSKVEPEVEDDGRNNWTD